MDKTNYPLLAIVAAVALTAIVAMVTLSQNSPGVSASPVLTLTDGFGDTEAGLTGNVVANDRATRPLQEPNRERPGLDWSQYDYNSDGTLTSEDTQVLVDVVARSRFCPEGRVCDINNDGIVDIVDKRAYDTTMLRIEAQRAEAHEIMVGTPSPLIQDDEFWLAVTGAPAYD